MKRVSGRFGVLITGVILFQACSEGPSAPPVPAALQASGTIASSAVVGSTMAPAVLVTDAQGKAIGSVNVTFEVTGGDGAVTTSSVATDGSGRASTTWTLGTASGTQTLQARAASLAPVTFTVTGTPDVPASLTAVSTNPATAPVGQVLTTAPGVVVRDRHGNAVGGVQVSFSPAPGSGSVTGGTRATGADGIARPDSWTLGTSVGTQVLSAATGTLTAALNITTTPGAPASIAASAGAGQSVPVGQSAPVRPAVRVRDTHGNPVPGVAVTFAVGGGSVTGPSQVTDAAGNATVGSWTMGTTTGEYTLTASAAGTSTVITATAIAGPPAAVTKTGGDGQQAQPGSPVGVAPTVRVADQFGNNVPGAVVTFAIASGGGSLVGGGARTTGADGSASVGGWTLGAVGTNTLSATVSGVPAVTFSATATTTAPSTLRLQRFGGDNTTCPVTSNGCSFTVQIVDATGTPVARGGEAIEWRHSTGATLTNVTNTGGRATAPNIAASGVSGSATQTARLLSTGDTTTFTYTAVQGGQYGLDVRFIGSATASQQAIFNAAAARWQDVITGDLQDINIPAGFLAAGVCGINHPAFAGPIDDLLIFIEVDSIDGPGQVLGGAGPCLTRTADGLPIIGVMVLDEADVAQMEQDGELHDVVLHEMGHILGIGSLWSGFGLLQNAGTSTVAYTGVRAQPGFVLAGGPFGNVPVENCLNSNGVPITGCGSGTVDSHWREAVLGNELMTGYVGSNNNPLSYLTIGSLMDMGYQVNFGAADTFSFGGASLRSAVDVTRKLNEFIIRPTRVLPRM